MGIVINKAIEDMRLPDLLLRLDIVSREDSIQLPQAVEKMPVQFGGPVETGRGFVLHTTDYFASDSTLAIDEGIGLTASLDILRALVQGKGPKHALLALGYAGWGPGQLESEIQHNGWLHCDADTHILFDDALDRRYAAALSKLGVDVSFLSSEAGHA